MTRAVILWMVVIAIVSAFVFLGFHIIKTTTGTLEDVKERYIEYKPPVSEQLQRPSPVQQIIPSSNEQEEETQAPTKDESEQYSMPTVVGQSEEELRAPEPHIATPPSTYYDTPEATDPLDRVGYMDAEFGSNLRHPEQMIERRPARNTDRMVESGLGSKASGPGGNNTAGYTPETTNNGGEFMQGIIPFDSTEMGGGFSMI